ncbi:MAG TPA: TrkH family potassium uptake protein [Nitrospiria bacterium]|jgi:trk system potassium uptake protein TrkH
MNTLNQAETSRRSFFHRVQAVRLLPGQIVAIAGLFLILLGAGLLMLPISTPPDVHMGFLDAFFTATSAVCVTGLIVMDTPHDFTMFGQMVVLLLVQIGGLGYALMATLILVVLGRRLGLRDRMMLAETFSSIDLEGGIRFVKWVAFLTFGLEGLGMLYLTFRFSQDMAFGQAVYYGLFHSVSAFNNAGFSLFSTSLIPFQSDVGINLVVTTLIILGSLGFMVLRDVIDNVKGKQLRFQSHTKVVLVMTAIILTLGTLGIAALEWENSETFQTMGYGERLGASYFQSVSRTAGFTTIDIGQMSDATLYFLILLMAIGGSPGSMSGGIKTTTFAIVCLTVWSVLKRRNDVELFQRRLSSDLVIKAFCLSFLAFTMIVLFTLMLAYTEDHPFLAIMFEVTSAMGIVGLSLGDGLGHSLSAALTDFGKMIIIVSMLLGRFGPLMIGLFAMKNPGHSLYRYPQSRIVIG